MFLFKSFGRQESDKLIITSGLVCLLLLLHHLSAPGSFTPPTPRVCIFENRLHCCRSASIIHMKVLERTRWSGEHPVWEDLRKSLKLPPVFSVPDVSSQRAVCQEVERRLWEDKHSGSASTYWFWKRPPWGRKLIIFYSENVVKARDAGEKGSVTVRFVAPVARPQDKLFSGTVRRYLFVIPYPD